MSQDARPKLELIEGGAANPPRSRQRIGDYFTVPFGYEAWADGLYRFEDGVTSPELAVPNIAATPPPKHRASLTSVARRPLWITRRGRTLDTHEELVELAALAAGGGVVRTWATRTDLAERQKLVALLSAKGFPVRTGNAAGIEEYLDRALHENAQALPEQLLAARSGAYQVPALIQTEAGVGYGSAWGWLIGDQWIGPGSVERDTRVESTWSSGFSASGDLAVWIDGFRMVNGFGPIARWLTGTAFAALLLRFIGHRTFIVHHWGQSRGGKTALVRFGASVVGNAQLLVAHHNRTDKSFTEVFRYASDLPVAFDELQSGARDRDHSTLIYSLCLERGRARANQQGGLVEEIAGWRAVVRMTGEESVVGRERLNLGGQGTRVVEIGEAALSPADAKTLNLWVNNGPYGVAGPAFLRWLVPIVGLDSGIALLRALFDGLVRQLEPVVGASHDRAAHLAAGALGEALSAHVLLDEPLEAALDRAVSDATVVGGVAAKGEAAYATVAERALQVLRDHRASQREFWLDLSVDTDLALVRGLRFKNAVGIVTPTEVWLIQAEINRVFARAGLPASRVWTDLGAEGWLKADGAQGTAVRREGLFHNRVYVITRAAFDCLSR